VFVIGNPNWLIGKSDAALWKSSILRRSPWRGSDTALLQPKFRHAPLAWGALLQQSSALSSAGRDDLPIDI